ncbi:5'-methylthioadenosine/adenosylhomocysteine nucleosidase [Paenibacillus pasadenensis]|uniref:5'-methylthioadenosine/adenosylhomocysteine nucleosidase n=1 Tax=Paenibacillus pasadenensis TaxID=217090 RepID=UPI0020401967|nr:5'-methylthioadenosine/adenosylhomocysteine nucleosidase [Paenibacillus pasadenensis]MCM3746190.1 5'-methylthioadenosine/adenosylhomocysteine nucleosidase [Paenibacillus pasadenensis]
MKYGTIGIIGAMKEELELLYSNAQMESETVKAGMTFRRGTLHGQPIIAVQSGVGKVNAAVCTQALIDLGADCVLFTGVAGAVDPELNIGDIVVSTACVQHDMDVTPLGFQPGVIPYQEISTFPADPELVELAAAAGSRAAKGKAVRGIVLSGDQFIASREKVQSLREVFQGACAEMEGASLAQVCHMNAIPYVVIRSMSDQADGIAHMNFAEFTVLAANQSFAVIDDMIRSLKN